MSEDAGGNDPSILDGAELWRRINPEWVVFDANLGCKRPTSQAFQNLSGNSMSVLLEPTLRDLGKTPGDVLAAFPGFSLATITAGFARQNGQGVVRVPEPDEPAHCHVIGEKTKSVRKAFAREAIWITPPL